MLRVDPSSLPVLAHISFLLSCFAISSAAQGTGKREQPTLVVLIYIHLSCTSPSPGDTIRSVNGHSVTLDNIDSVLAGLSNEVCIINIIIIIVCYFPLVHFVSLSLNSTQDHDYAKCCIFVYTQFAYCIYVCKLVCVYSCS